jgi:gluconolactonase
MSLRLPLVWVAAFGLAGLVLAGGRTASAADAPGTTKITAGDLALTVPASWHKEEVTSQYRKAQMKVPKVGDDPEDADFVVYYFDGGGGGPAQNLDRWVQQFQQAGRKAQAKAGTTRQGEKYVFLDLQGTWNKPVGPMIQQRTRETPKSRALSVILTTKHGNYFLRLTGPEKTVTENLKAFRETFGADEASEKDQPL